MGVNNKQRRAAKQRKRNRQRRGGGSATGPGWSDPGWREAAARGLVELEVTKAVRRLARRKVDHAELLRQAEALPRRIGPHPRHLLETVVADLLERLQQGAVDGGWDQHDLEQLVGRCAGERHLPTLTVLFEPGRRWIPLGTPDQLASGLQVAALLATLPLLETGSVPHRQTEGSMAHPKLAQVRALLAKAESSDYDEEAEALSAKAQELITRYALDRLLRSDSSHPACDDASDRRPSVRRLWLDAPYVRAKSALVAEVADANRCRSASAERFSFCVVVGTPADLDAVELLVTSLLVQADSAMLRHGRRFDESGSSRTRSFRQSFLVAYAARIGERLRATTAETVSSQEAGRLLPVLRDHMAEVSEAFDAMVPHTVGNATGVTDGEGWAAGLAAADLALLDVNGKLTEEAG